MRRNVLALGLTMPWLSACSPSGILAALTRFGGETRLGIAYGAHARQKLDVYRAQGGASGTPTVLFFYGGSWSRGERGDYAFVGKALAARGITTVIADYRLFPEVRYPDFLNDCAMAGAWTLREVGQLGGDSKRVFVMGHSAGAYNAAMLALDARWLRQHGADPSQWAGWIGMAGPYEFLPISNPDAQPVFFHPDYPPLTQPIEWASNKAPRTLLLSARDDVLVNPVRNSQALAEKLKSARIDVEYSSFDRVSHQTLIGALASPLAWLAPVAQSVERFVGTPVSR